MPNDRMGARRMAEQEAAAAAGKFLEQHGHLERFTGMSPQDWEAFIHATCGRYDEALGEFVRRPDHVPF